MNTLHRFRKFAFAAALATGALLASSAQAGSGHSRAVLATVTELGAMTVQAGRLAATQIADLGAITVTARLAGPRIADLGGLTVTARRSARLVVADSQSAVATPNTHSWN